MEPKYKVTAPIGNVVTPKIEMTQSEIRVYASQIATSQAFKNKAIEDPFVDVLEMLTNSGFKIQAIK